MALANHGACALTMIAIIFTRKLSTMHAPLTDEARHAASLARLRRWRWRWPLIGLGLAYLLANGTLYGIQRTLVFQPRAGGDAVSTEAVGMVMVRPPLRTESRSRIGTCHPAVPRR